jgi:hypothetical protein
MALLAISAPIISFSFLSYFVAMDDNFFRMSVNS